jgi:hypothetical protein
VSDVNANIGIHFDTAGALAELRRLQAGLSKFNQTLVQGNVAAANAQKGLTASMLQSINATGKFSASQVRVATSTQAFTSALEKNQLSLKQYYRYTAAAATANTSILKRAFASEREIFNRARADRVKAIQTQYIQMGKATGGMVDALKIMPRSLAMANGKYTELGTRIQYAAQRQQLMNQLLRQGSTSLLNYGKNMQWAGRQLMVGLSIPLMLFATAASKAFRDLEKETVNFRRVYGNMLTSDAEANTAVENIKRIGIEYTKFGISVKDTMAMAAKAAAAGFSGGALNQQVQTATKLAVLGQIDQQQALETTISLSNAFGIASEDLAKKIDFLNAVENQTVLSIEDLTIAIPKAAPIVKQLGGNVEDLAFFLTAMKEGGINASEGANALKSGLASMINPTKKASDMLSGFGINIKGIVDSNAGNLKNTVIGFAQALDTLDPLNRARAIEQMFGKFQFARISTLFQNITKDGSQASRVLGLAGASIQDLAILSQREMDKVKDAVGVKFQAAIEKFKVTIMPIGKAFLEALTPVVQTIGKIFEKFNNLSDGTKKFVAIMVAVLGGIGPIALMTFGLLANGVANVIKFFAMLRGGIAKLNGQTKLLGSGFDYLTQDQLENTIQSNALHTSHQKLIQVFGVERSAVEALGLSYQTAASQARTLAASSPGLFVGGKAGAIRATSGLKGVKKYAEGVLTVPGPKGAGDIQPAMLAPGEAVIPAKLTEKHHGLLKAIMSDNIPGHMAGKLPAAKPSGPKGLSPQLEEFRKAQEARREAEHARNLKKYPWIKPTVEAGRKSQSSSKGLFLGMPKSFDAVTRRMQQEITLKEISSAVEKSRFSGINPTDFGVKLSDTSGRSFPVPGIGGIYQKPNGEKVFVKPVMDEMAALAEVRATELASKAHGLYAPKQTIKTMRDPSDPTGSRKLLVLESPFDPKFAEANMKGKFTKEEYFKQLVAANLRGDKDLHAGNLSGNVIADVGTAGVFKMASGQRSYEANMPSMAEQAKINLLGVKGGARRFFAESTLPIPLSMSPAEYQAAMLKEIETVLPKLKSTIKTFGLNKEEKIVYQNMINRLEEGRNVNWAEFHAVHSAVVPAKTKELSAAAIAKKFEEQQLKKRQSGHANQDFWVKGAVDGYLPPSSAGVGQTGQIELNKFIADMDREYSSHQDPVTQKQYLRNRSGFVDLVKQFKFNPETQSFTLARTKDGSLTRPFTLEEAKAELKYAMRESQKRGETSSRPISPSTFRRALEGFGKGSTGAPSYVKTALNRASKENPTGSTLKMKQVMDRLKEKYNLSDKQVSKSLRYEAAHIKPSGFGPEDPRNWQHGQVFSEFGVANNFLNTVKNPREFTKLLNNPKTKLPVSQGGLGYTDAKITQLQKDLLWASANKHPTTQSEFAKLVRLAEFNTLAAEAKILSPAQMKSVYQAEAVMELGKIRQQSGFFDDFYKRAIGLSAKKEAIRYNSQKEYLDAQKIVATPGEGILDPKKKTLETVKPTSGKPKTSQVTRVGGSPSDTRIVTQKAGTKVISKPTMRLLGKATGDGGVSISVAKGNRAVELRNQGVPQSVIDKELLKYEKELLKKKRNIDKQNLKAQQAKTRAAEQQAASERAQARQAVIQANTQKNISKAEQRAMDRIRIREDRAVVVNKAHEEALRMQAKMDKDELAAKKKRQTQMARAGRQETAGKIGGPVAGAAGAIAMGAMMSGADSKVTGGLFALSAVAGLLPMLMNPVVAASAAVLALTGSMWLYSKSIDNARKSGIALADSMSMTSGKLVEISKITKTVSAYESSRSVRESKLSGADAVTRKSGETFLTSAPGKTLMADVNTQIKNGSSNDIIAKNIATQLGVAITQGVITMDQAKSISSALGEQLGNYEIPIQVSGTLTGLFGSQGQNLLTDPLKITLELQKKSLEQQQVAYNSAIGTPKGGTAANGGAMVATGAYIAAAGAATSIAASAGLIAASNFWNPVGWAAAIVGIGAIAKGTWDWVAANKEKTKIDSAAIQLGVDHIAQGQMAIDALNKQFDIKKAMAKTDEERQTVEDDRVKALKSQSDQNAADLKILIEQKKILGSDAFNAGIKTSVTERYKDSSSAIKTYADKAVTDLAGMKDTNFKATLQLELASGNIDPVTVTRLINLAANDKTIETKFDALITATGSAADANLVMQLLAKSGASDATVSSTLDFLLTEDGKKNIKEYTDAINIISDMGAKYGVTVDINVDTEKQIKAISDFKKILDGIKGKDGKPVTSLTKLQVQTMADGGNQTMKDILANWGMLVGADGKQIDTTMSIDFVAAEGSQAVLDAYLSAKGITIPTFLSPESQAAARKNFMPDAAAYRVGNSKTSANGPKIPGVTDTPAKTARAADPVDELMRRLKNVRLAAIDAEGGIKALFKAVSGGQIGNKFKGIEQQLMGMDPTKGANGQFIDWLTSLDKTTQAKYAKTVTKVGYNPFTGKKDKAYKDKKVGDFVLNKDGKEIQAGFDKAIIGDFQNAQVKIIRNFDQQVIASRKLKALGMSNSEIQRILSDEAYVTAIATGKITDQELKTNNTLVKQAELRTKVNGIVAQGDEAAQLAADFKRRSEVGNFLNKSGLSKGIPPLAVDAALNDPGQLSALIAAMDAINSKTAGAAGEMERLLNAIKNIKANSDIQLTIGKTSTEIIQQGAGAALEGLAAKKRLMGGMNISQIANYKTESGKSIGAAAIAKIAPNMVGKDGKAMTAEGLTSMLGNKTLIGVQRERASLANSMNVAQQGLANIQSRYNAIQNSLQSGLDSVNAYYDAQEKAAQANIDSIQKVADSAIKAKEDIIANKFDKPIQEFQDQSNALSHDLSVMDHAAQAINDKYDAQQTALENILSINEKISREQQQQLGLADALTSGDISAAAKAAQDIRSGNASDYGTGQMDALQKGRQNSIDGLTNAKGQTKAQILEEQYQISEKIYALETDPLRKQLEEEIAAIRTKAEADVLAAQTALDALGPARAAALAAKTAEVQAQLTAVKAEMDAQQTIVDKLVEQDEQLALAEVALAAINEEMAAQDEFAGHTADEWQDIIDKANAASDVMEERMKKAMAAIAESTGSAAQDIASILADLNAMPSSKSISIYVTEYRTVVTSYVDNGDPNAAANKATADAKAKADAEAKAKADADALAKKKADDAAAGKTDNTSTSQDDIIARNAAANAEAERLAALAKQNAQWAAQVAGYATRGGAYSMGGMVPKYMSNGGLSIGTDTVPAMLTPGEFVMSKYAVNSHGVDKMKAINNGDSVGDSVYNYSVSVNVSSDASPDDIARTVIRQIKQIDSQKIGGSRL